MKEWCLFAPKNRDSYIGRHRGLQRDQAIDDLPFSIRRRVEEVSKQEKRVEGGGWGGSGDWVCT